jgi:hypothetical protein
MATVEAMLALALSWHLLKQRGRLSLSLSWSFSNHGLRRKEFTGRPLGPFRNNDEIEHRLFMSCHNREPRIPPT